MAGGSSGGEKGGAVVSCDDGLCTHLQERRLDPVVLDHAVAAQVRDEFRIGRAGAAPSHACGRCEFPGASPR